ncbi:hypothetical protein [Nocardia wallacei]|uniref:hypothetical protein n=1 Tax=Nocardia wallacei TaxID=480035 RepID=UPI002455811D|nr:hypothetical protein [Nocardia wallacei]
MTDDTTTAADTRLPDGTPARLGVRCRKCNNWLFAQPSFDARIGPVCAAHEREEALARREPGLFDLPPTT